MPTRPLDRLRGFLAASPGTVIAAIVLTVIAFAALLAPLIAPQNPFDLGSFDVLDAELPPSWLQGGDPRFLLGTDAQGRDLFSAILYGTRISLAVGVLAVAIQAAIGIPLGLIAGTRGGTVDSLIARAADIQLSLSTLMLAIIALALFRAGLGGASLGAFAVPLLVLVIGLAEWPTFARTARAATHVEAAKDYVRAARALGASDTAIVRRHILPNILSPLIVVATTQVAGAIMAEAALSFLGLGHAGDQALARHSDPLGLRPDLRRRLVGDRAPGAGAGAPAGRRQRARRLAPRRARSAAFAQANQRNPRFRSEKVECPAPLWGRPARTHKI